MSEKMDALMQERIDELMLLEIKSEQRAIEFNIQVEDYKEQSICLFERLKYQEKHVNTAITTMVADTNAAIADAEKQHGESINILYSWLIMVGMFTVVVLFSMFWGMYIKNELSAARLELSELNRQIKYTPTIACRGKRCFVRVIAGTESSITAADGSYLPGEYMEFWK